jgi:hypothetical protein
LVLGIEFPFSKTSATASITSHKGSGS